MVSTSSSSNEKGTSPIFLLFVFLIFIGLMVYTFLDNISDIVSGVGGPCDSPFLGPFCKIGGWAGMGYGCITSPATCQMNLLQQDISDTITSLKNASISFGQTIQAFLLNHCAPAKTAFITSSQSAFSFIFGKASLEGKGIWDNYKTSFEKLFNCENNQNITSFGSALYIFSALLSFVFFFLAIIMAVFMRWFPSIFSALFSYLTAIVAYVSANNTVIGGINNTDLITNVMNGAGMFFCVFFVLIYIIFTIMFIQTIWFILYLLYIKFGEGAKISLPKLSDFSSSISAEPIMLIIAGIGGFLVFITSHNIRSAALAFVLIAIGLYVFYRATRRGDGNFYLPTLPSLVMNNIIPIALALISLRLVSLREFFGSAAFLNIGVVNACFSPAGTSPNIFSLNTGGGANIYISIVYVLLFVLVMAIVNQEIFLKLINGEEVNLWVGALRVTTAKIRKLTANITKYKQDLQQKRHKFRELDEKYKELNLRLQELIKPKMTQEEIEEKKKIEQQMQELIKEREKLEAEMTVTQQIINTLISQEKEFEEKFREKVTKNMDKQNPYKK